MTPTPSVSGETAGRDALREAVVAAWSRDPLVRIALENGDKDRAGSVHRDHLGHMAYVAIAALDGLPDTPGEGRAPMFPPPDFSVQDALEPDEDDAPNDGVCTSCGRNADQAHEDTCPEWLDERAKVQVMLQDIYDEHDGDYDAMLVELLHERVRLERLVMARLEAPPAPAARPAPDEGLRGDLTGDWHAEGTWLAIDVGRHTCGTGPDGHYGAHEPGCGLEPIENVGDAGKASAIAADHNASMAALRAALDRAALAAPDRAEPLLPDHGEPQVWEDTRTVAGRLATEQVDAALAPDRAEQETWYDADDPGWGERVAEARARGDQRPASMFRRPGFATGDEDGSVDEGTVALVAAVLMALVAAAYIAALVTWGPS